jgi:hypothetical protein
MSFHLQCALAPLIAVSALFGSLSAARADVKIIAAGYALMSNNDFAVFRYNSDGRMGDTGSGHCRQWSRCEIPNRR